MHKQLPPDDPSSDSTITPTYASRFLSDPVSKYDLPQDSMAPDVAYQLIKDELQLDGNAHMNLATFVTTWMEPQAAQLMAETFEKNLIDKDEYPQTAEIERRCINILAQLWNAPREGSALGTSTVGSSEACMLAGMAFKWRWRSTRQKASKSASTPNLVLGANAQICWDKFCRYFEVEPRFVPLETGRYHLDPKAAAELCDENTIGVVGILGSTIDGSYEPIQKLSVELDGLEKRTGLNIPIHVDAASGGFVAPFLDPDLIWDFRLLRVKSINTSGHKYGMVYPGVGWVVWRHPHDLPEELIFKVNYLGGEMPTFALNFSKPGNGVIAQYYNFLRLGKNGYREIQERCRKTALYLSDKIARLGPFELLTSGNELPVFACTLKAQDVGFSLYDLSDRLRERGWQVPAYTMPKNLEQITIMRFVVKENFSRDMADLLLEDIAQQLAWLTENQLRRPSSPRNSFHH
ncbi:MAG TPA: glutamate decarboxylase [Verrucomicrobiae bacterium]|nr:glutamate decarboxylase [Verrucomicrobiae bacterium]